MNYNQIKIENITIDENHNIFYKNSNNIRKKLILKTPKLYIPFGIDRQEKKLYINAQLRKTTDTKYNSELDLFETCIQNIETHFKNSLNKPINSQLRYSDKYDTIITLKIKKNKDKITTEIKENNRYFNLYSIKKQTYMVSEIIIDKLWIYNDTIYYKIKLTKIDYSV
jgi:hypothetical protein